MENTDYKIGDKVEITWIDSRLNTNKWYLKEDIKLSEIEPTNVTSLGFIVESNADFITIAQSYGINPSHYSGLITIPKGCIKKCNVL